MGAVQRLATVVVIGLVALATILVLYLADEGNRIEAEEEEQEEAAIERGIETFVTYCVACHGPAGEGALGPDGRVGLPLGGDTYATQLNQEGINQQGTPVPLDTRAELLRETIVNGRGTVMPAWGEELNAEQIDELVVMIQNVDWDLVYNEAIDVAGGYPTPPPPPGAAQQPAEGESSTEGSGDQAAGAEQAPESGSAVVVDMVDYAFEPATLEIQANTDVTIQLTNSGGTVHDLSIEELDIHAVLNPGESTEITVNAAAGEYEYICSQPGHKELGMVGTLSVK